MTDKLRTQLVDNLLTVLASMKSEDEVYKFLLDLCTVREIAEMSQRLEVARLLADGQSYVYVQEVTGASATTISRVSKCLNYGSGGYEAALALIGDGLDGTCKTDAGTVSNASTSDDSLGMKGEE